MPVKGTVLDVKALRAIADDYGDAATSALGPAMTRALNILEAQAVEICPADIGNLEASTVTEVRFKGKRVTGELAFVTPYAAKVHELPSDARGPKTQAKPGNEFGPAGPKYLERPLRGMQKNFPEVIAEELKKQL
jgi:hypothetical protein